MNISGALKKYQVNNLEGGVMDADPHRLIQMLMEGALEKMAKASVFLEQKNIEQKSQHIAWAISIVGGLKDSLDMKVGGEVVDNLAKLYDYMVAQLTAANIDNDIEKIKECQQLMADIKEGWDGIRQEALAMLNDKA